MDPYRVLGVSREATDEEVRGAYRRLVKLHHPDHNHGSAESAKRFEAVQQAYAEVQRLRKQHEHGQAEQRRPSGQRPSSKQRQPHSRPKPPPVDGETEARLADLERQVRAAHAARERAEQAAREAVQPDDERPSNEELGYVDTDDSLTKILADARTEFSERYEHTRERPVAKRVSDLIKGLEELTEKLDRKPRH